MAELPPRRCAVCYKRNGLRRCSGCQVVHFCSRAHQRALWAQHKPGCMATQMALRRLAAAETELRETLDDSDVDDVDDDDDGDDTVHDRQTWSSMAGHFWGIVETRDYMRARFDFVDSLLAHNTRDGIELGLFHLGDMMLLSRSDNMGLRDHVPDLLIRLGWDQEAYDFIKWWAVTSEKRDYDWGDVTQPFLHLKDEDIFEGATTFTQKSYALGHMMSLTLLKIRLYMDLRDMSNVRHALKGTLPPELINNIRDHVPRTNVVAARRDLNGDKAAVLLRKLQAQIKSLVADVASTNKCLWPNLPPAVMCPEKILKLLPGGYVIGSEEEALTVLQTCHLAWAESPGSIEIVRKAGGQVAKLERN